jgi:TctA family transporter
LCPQFDTLVERLSVRENLILFAEIKGSTTDILTGLIVHLHYNALTRFITPHQYWHTNTGCLPLALALALA